MSLVSGAKHDRVSPPFVQVSSIGAIIDIMQRGGGDNRYFRLTQLLYSFFFRSFLFDPAALRCCRSLINVECQYPALCCED